MFDTKALVVVVLDFIIQTKNENYRYPYVSLLKIYVLEIFSWG